VLEARDSIIYFNKTSKKLGKRFYQDFESKLSLVVKKPHSFQIKYKSIRALSLKSFPFLIHFKIVEVTKKGSHLENNPHIKKPKGLATIKQLIP
jgi:hypothetical protein